MGRYIALYICIEKNSLGFSLLVEGGVGSSRPLVQAPYIKGLIPRLKIKQFLST